jgi:CRISPR/Cas system endoribonuclease Cas6 (RAMP superfamily)
MKNLKEKCNAKNQMFMVQKLNVEEKVVIAKRNELGTISPIYYTSSSLMKK